MIDGSAQRIRTWTWNYTIKICLSAEGNWCELNLRFIDIWRLKILIAKLLKLFFELFFEKLNKKFYNKKYKCLSQKKNTKILTQKFFSQFFIFFVIFRTLLSRFASLQIKHFTQKNYNHQKRTPTSAHRARCRKRRYIPSHTIYEQFLLINASNFHMYTQCRNALSCHRLPTPEPLSYENWIVFSWLSGLYFRTKC
jgi:hypothetical protein